MKAVYRSAVDTWLLLALGAGGLLALVAAVSVFAAGDAAARGIAVLTLFLGVGLPLWILTTTSYTLDGDTLLVRSGPVTRRVPIADITAVVPTRNPLSSPALSLDRLRIEVRGARPVMISPADRTGFLADLDARRAAVSAHGIR
jgi:hypothetical protein